MKKTTWPGNWKVVCDVCGFEYPSGEVKKRWDGLIVCEKDYETRHPQTLYKYRHRHSVPAFTRPRPKDVFVEICDIVTSSGRVGLGTIGCMQVGNDAQSYRFLVELDDGYNLPIPIPVPTPYYMDGYIEDGYIL